MDLSTIQPATVINYCHYYYHYYNYDIRGLLKPRGATQQAGDKAKNRTPFFSSQPEAPSARSPGWEAQPGSRKQPGDRQ